MASQMGPSGPVVLRKQTNAATISHRVPRVPTRPFENRPGDYHQPKGRYNAP